MKCCRCLKDNGALPKLEPGGLSNPPKKREQEAPPIKVGDLETPFRADGRLLLTKVPCGQKLRSRPVDPELSSTARPVRPRPTAPRSRRKSSLGLQRLQTLFHFRIGNAFVAFLSKT